MKEKEMVEPKLRLLYPINSSCDVINSRCGPSRKHLWTYFMPYDTLGVTEEDGIAPLGQERD